jgi:hypothetical protein
MLYDKKKQEVGEMLFRRRAVMRRRRWKRRRSIIEIPEEVAQKIGLNVYLPFPPLSGSAIYFASDDNDKC